MKTDFVLFPRAASTIAPEVDGLTIALTILCGLIVLLVAGLIIFFSVRYRKGSPHNRVIRAQRAGLLNISLLWEWGWTIGTFVAFLAIFGFATTTYFKMHRPPEGAEEILVVGKQWMWKFQHLSGIRELNELHIPAGRPISFTMTSQDVIHSFFAPEFRIKQDVVPGRYTHTWFEALEPGEYHLFCTQYCGTEHSKMVGRIIVMEKSAYERWLQTGLSGGAAASGETMASRGGKLFTRLGCYSCHGINPGKVAPNLHGLYGSQVGLSDGTSVMADENYLRESIINPKAKIVLGYPDIMPSFSGVASEEDLLDLIAFIKSLQSSPTSEAPEGAAPTAPGSSPTLTPTSQRQKND
jgi:cytochrome c oxidase subunit 2